MVALAALLFAITARAQDIPAADASFGYSFLFVAKGYTLSMNGGSSTVALNLNRWLGVVGDLGIYDGSPGIPRLIGETYTFGPRFSFRKWTRLTPFAQAVIGGAHANSTNGGFLGANNAFVYGGGGGGGLGLDRAGRVALRAQMEFLGFHTKPSETGTVRVSAGIVVRFGRRY